MKLLIKVMLFWVLIFLGIKTDAQRYEYDISEITDVPKKYYFEEHLVSTSESHYLYLAANNGISILKYNYDFKNVFVDQIETENNDVSHLSLKYNNGLLGWFTVNNNFKNKQFEYELTSIDLEGNIGRPKSIVNMRYKSDKRVPKATFKYSADSSKMMMVLEIDFERTDKYSAYVAVFDYDFNKIYEIDFYPNVSQRQFDVFNWDLGNDGKVYLSSIIYNKDNKDSDRKVKGQQVQAYKAMVYQFSDGSQKEIELREPGHFVKKSNVVAGKGDNVLITYAYGYRTDDPIEGFKLSLRSAQTFDEINTDGLAFTANGLNSYSRLEYFENSRGIGLRPTFEFYESKVEEDGSIEVMLDYHYMVVTRNNFGGTGSFSNPATNYDITTFYDASMFLMRIDSSGKLIRSTLLPRRFGSTFEGNMGSTLLTNKDQSIVFYNDSDNNLDNNVSNPSNRIGVTSSRYANFTLADIDNSNAIKRSIVFNFREEELVLIPNSIRKLGENKYFFAAYDLRSSSERYKFGLFDVMDE